MKCDEWYDVLAEQPFETATHLTVDSAHFSAVVDVSKWYTEDKPDDMVVEMLGMSYKWLAQKEMEKP